MLQAFFRGKRWLPFALASALSILLIAVAGYVFTMRASIFESVFGEPTVQNLPLPSGENDEELPISAAALFTQAERALGNADTREALALFEQALERGGDIAVMNRVFDAALLLGDRAKAEYVLGLLSFHGVPETTLESLRGFLAIMEGKTEDARLLFASGNDRFGLLVLSILDGNHGEAKEYLKTLASGSDPLIVHQANILQGAYDEFALFEDGRSEHLKTLLARSLGQIGQWPAATVLLKDAVSADPEYRDASILLGYALLMRGLPADALTALERAYSIDPEKSETQFFLGLAHEKLGNGEEARTFLEYALRNGFEPKQSVREKLASLAEDRGSLDEAIAQYQAMLAEGDADATHYRRLMTLLVEYRQDIPQAQEIAEKAREVFGDESPDVLDLMGWSAFLTDDFDQAASFLSTAVTQDPTLASAWYHKGLLEEKLQDTEQARASYRRAYEEALASDPKLASQAAEKYNALVTEEVR